jgi:oligopeptide transport system substrate-binding protein
MSSAPFRSAPAPRALLALALPLALPVVAFFAGRPQALPPADFTFVMPKEIATLDPALAGSVAENWLAAACFEGLLRFDPTSLEPVPAAALGFELSSDGLEYAFAIDPRARWSDGRQVAAQDFATGWRRLLDPATGSPNAHLLDAVVGARAAAAAEGELGAVALDATDPTRFVVRLERPCPYFPSLVALAPLAPLRADLIARHGEAFLAPANFVGNGPYRPVLRRMRDRVRLVRNEEWRAAGSVAFGVVDALAVDSKATALNLFLEGSVDWVNAVPALALPRLAGRAELRLAINLGTIFVRMNVTDGPLADPRVRRAIDLAIDREALCRYVYAAGERPAHSLVPPSLPGYVPPAKRNAEPSVDDVAAARALLAAAGHPGGEGLPEFELLHAADENARAVATAIAAGLTQRLGIRVRPSPQEFKVFIDSMKQRKYQLALGNWIGDYPDASNFLEIFRGGSPNNRTGWSDPRYDAALDAAASCVEPARRALLLADAEALLLESGPIAPIAYRGQPNLVATDIEGFSDNLLDVHPLELLRRRLP